MKILFKLRKFASISLGNIGRLLDKPDEPDGLKFRRNEEKQKNRIILILPNI